MRLSRLQCLWNTLEVGRPYSQATVKESTGHLAIRGIRMECKKLCRLTERLAERGIAYRNWLMEQVRLGKIRGISAKGKRLVIGMDGGRLRTRVNRPGRRRKSGRHAFDAKWREPKVLIIYEVDAKGRRVRNGLLRYDATLKDADALFAILKALLVEIGAGEAASWTFVGDGAPWLWDRIPGLVKAIGYKADSVTEVLDFYHACEHLQEFAEAIPARDGFDLNAWVRKMKRLLKAGKLDTMLAEAGSFCIGPKGEELRAMLDYFETRRARMDYARVAANGLPIGSGAVESAVRRIVNLRFKGNSIYWDESNAEGMLHLRSQLLADRWDEFVRTVLTHEAFWEQGQMAKAS